MSRPRAIREEIEEMEGEFRRSSYYATPQTQAQLASSLEFSRPPPSSASVDRQPQQQRSSASAASALPDEAPQRSRTAASRQALQDTCTMNDVDALYVLLLDVVDKLKLGSAIDLPEIAVIGDQSDGKSTVLEAIAKVNLPKGDSTCTKCLIRLCIRKKKEERITIAFKDKTIDVNKQESDFSAQLKQLMDESFPDKQTSMTEEITVTIIGPDRPNLTVVDVPGFRNDDPQEKTDALENRLKSTNVVMVVVLKAITDIDTSRGYALAKRVDPDFKRTVFVMTHCDNVTENKQGMIRDMLNQKHCVFAVNCYVKTGNYSSEKEKIFFEEQPFWRSFPPSVLGTQSLTMYLAHCMREMILPRKEEMHLKVMERWSSSESTLKELMEKKQDISKEVKTLVSKTNKEIDDSVTGRHSTKKNKIYSRCYAHWTEFGDALKDITKTLRKELPSIIDKEQVDQRGWELQSLENVFPILVRIIDEHVMSKIEPAVENLISKCEMTVESGVCEIVEEQMKNHEPLRIAVQNRIRSHLRILRSDVKKHMKTIIDMEKIVFQSERWNKDGENDTHGNDSANQFNLADSVKGAAAAAGIASPAVGILADGAAKVLSLAASQADKKKTHLQKKIEAYVDFVECRLANSIPKAIANFMLHKFAADIWELVTDNMDGETKIALESVFDTGIKKYQVETELLEQLLSRFSMLRHV